ncbi:MAG: hypothetical protein RLN88_04135 [Ekhidna sp.]|uniref:hypothetical protein n=1 Tax=Ekhidna sp. TaxID=2608089 RepID=UPI0032EAE0EE
MEKIARHTKSMVGNSFKNAKMPRTREELEKILWEAFEAGHDGNSNRYTEDELREALYKQQVNLSYLFKCRLKKLEGVFRLPQESSVIIDRLNEIENDKS